MSDAKRFLEAIGLGVQMLERPKPTNIRHFPARLLMDSPDYAVFIHLRNLISTYGLATIEETLEIAKMED